MGSFPKPTWEAFRRGEKEENWIKALQASWELNYQKTLELRNVRYPSFRRKADVESYIVEQETRRLQDLESAVFNEFRKDVRKKFRRHSRSGRSVLSKTSESDR